MDMSERIQQARQQRGLSQARLAAIVQTSTSRVEFWERGHGMHIHSLVRLCRALEVTPNELLGWEQES